MNPQSSSTSSKCLRLPASPSTAVKSGSVTAAATTFTDPEVTAVLTGVDGPSALPGLAQKARDWDPDYTLYIFDARHACYRAWHTRDLSSDDGTSTSALHGLVGIVRSVLSASRGYRYLLAWDGFPARRNIYPGYKVRKTLQRTPEEAAEAERREAALRLAEHWASKLGMPSVTSPNLEADDIMGLVVHHLSSARGTHAHTVRRVVLVTDDRDVFQLIHRDSISGISVGVYRPIKDEVVGHQEFVARYGFAPTLWPHYKALVGESESGDNIPGVPGIGDTRAAALVAEHGGVESIYKACLARVNAATSGGPAVKKYERSMVENIEDARLSLRLSSILQNPSHAQSLLGIDSKEPREVLHQVFQAINPLNRSAMRKFRSAVTSELRALRFKYQFGDKFIQDVESLMTLTIGRAVV